MPESSWRFDWPPVIYVGVALGLVAWSDDVWGLLAWIVGVPLAYALGRREATPDAKDRSVALGDPS